MRASRYFTAKFTELHERTPVVAYGGGVNSVAMMLLLIDQQKRFDYVIFSDTGGERDSTYRYNEYFDKYLKGMGLPGITVVQNPHPGGLYADCMERKRLPSITYGFKSCSEKWKRRPYVQFLIEKELFPVICYKGIDFGESHRVRGAFERREAIAYPLVDAQMGRSDCIEFIKSKGLPVPSKSSCFFCPSISKSEVARMDQGYLSKAIEMERNAIQIPGGVVGLGRRWRWEDVVKQTVLFSEDELQGDYCSNCHT